MKLAKDKIQHIALTAVASIAIVGLCLLAAEFGLWAAALVGGAGLAIGYEMLQKYRGEGEPSWQDAAAGTAGAVAVALAVKLAGIPFPPV